MEEVKAFFGDDIGSVAKLLVEAVQRSPDGKAFCDNFGPRLEANT